MTAKNLYITLDFETFWSTDYSLSRMPTEEYVRDPQFKAHMLGVKIARDINDEGENTVIPHEDIPAFLERIKLENHIAVIQNAQFDGFILSEIYGVHPRFFCDTLGMSRWANGRRYRSHGLAYMSRALGIGEKGHELINSKGIRDFDPDLYGKIAGYCALNKDSDVNLTWRAFRMMLPACSTYSLDLIDWYTKAFTQPKLAIDVPTLAAGLAAVKDEKEGMLLEVARTLDIPGDDSAAIQKALRSAKIFSRLLAEEGAEPPIKTSPTTGKETFAFAKTDAGMLDLLGHANPRVVALVEARIGTNSSILESRMERLIGIGGRGLLPTPLNAFGAMTSSRGSGGGKLNLQNLPKKSAIRAAIVAPAGRELVVVDSSNIELRVEMKLAGQEDMNELLAAGGDPYCAMAEKIFNRPVTKEDVDDRFLGKLAMLSCGYEVGKDRFAMMARAWGVDVKRSFLDNVHDTYRTNMDAVVRLWKQADDALAAMSQGIQVPIGLDGVAHTVKDGIYLPGMGFTIKYPELRRDPEGQGWVYGIDGTSISIFGSKSVENLCQALSTGIIGEQMRIAKESYDLALQVHDELIMVVDEGHGQACKEATIINMSTSPTWWPEIVLAAEGGVGKRYSEAK